jgi:hypothetical protein
MTYYEVIVPVVLVGFAYRAWSRWHMAHHDMAAEARKQDERRTPEQAERLRATRQRAYERQAPRIERKKAKQAAARARYHAKHPQRRPTRGGKPVPGWDAEYGPPREDDA